MQTRSAATSSCCRLATIILAGGDNYFLRFDLSGWRAAAGARRATATIRSAAEVVVFLGFRSRDSSGRATKKGKAGASAGAGRSSCIPGKSLSWKRVSAAENHARRTPTVALGCRRLDSVHRSHRESSPHEEVLARLNTDPQEKHLRAADSRGRGAHQRQDSSSQPTLRAALALRTVWQPQFFLRGQHYGVVQS